jgi:hypothetical protein
MPVALSVLLELAGLLVGAAALGFCGWAWIARQPRAAARGGVVGREGRGYLYRDGPDLAFVRGTRRYRLPLEPEPHQAVRRTARVAHGSWRELTADVFRGSDHRIHTLAAADDPATVARVVALDRPRRLTVMATMPSWIVLPALGVALGLPALGLWLAGQTVQATVVDRYGSTGAVTCVLTWAVDGVDRTDDSGCPASVTVGSTLSVRALAEPFEGEVLADVSPGEVGLAALAGSFGLAGLALLVGRGAMAVGRDPMTLWPVVRSGPGLDGSTPDEQRRRARRMPLRDLALIAECVEGHADVEDNDLFGSTLREVWLLNQRRLGLGAGMALVMGCFVAAASSTPAIGVVVGLVIVTLVIGAVVVPGRGRLWSAWRSSPSDTWQPWDDAVAWRRLDGRVFVVLFDAGGALWWVPVDRVFSAGARVEISGRLGAGADVLVRANGVTLLSLGPVERFSEASASAMRSQLVQGLLGPAPVLRQPTR